MNGILWIYNAMFPLVLLVAAPWWLLQMATTARYREGLMERLGWVPRRFRQSADTREVIWVHAVSVGEVMAVLRLIQVLDAELAGVRVVLSTTTRTGQQLARHRLGAERVFYCPLDLAWATRAWLRVLKPRMLVLAETEFWPGLLNACFRGGIPVVVVNARISDRSWPRYQRLQRLWRPLLRHIRVALAQSELDAERLRALGCARVTAIGNLKYDLSAHAEAPIVRLLRGLAPQLRWMVAGSTLEGEEAALLTSWTDLIKTQGDLALLLAPRHPERFAPVARLLSESGLPWRRRSEITGDAPAIRAGEVVLLDTIGELAAAYALATVAFVGGSAVAAGGHNPLEAAVHAVPVVMGPHFENFRAIIEDLRADDAILIAGSGTAKDLSTEILALLEDLPRARAMGERGRAVVMRHAGATARAAEEIRKVRQAEREAEQ